MKKILNFEVKKEQKKIKMIFWEFLPLTYIKDK